MGVLQFVGLSPLASLGAVEGLERLLPERGVSDFPLGGAAQVSSLLVRVGQSWAQCLSPFNMGKCPDAQEPRIEELAMHYICQFFPNCFNHSGISMPCVLPTFFGNTIFIILAYVLSSDVSAFCKLILFFWSGILKLRLKPLPKHVAKQRLSGESLPALNAPCMLSPSMAVVSHGFTLLLFTILKI